MADLISRSAAIDQAMGKLDYTDVIFDTAIESEIVYMLRSLPSVPAVPLDKLCEWLAENALCIIRKNITPLKTDAGHWKDALTKWMEGLDAAD